MMSNIGMQFLLASFFSLLLSSLPAQASSLYVKQVSRFHAARHTCALISNNRVKCFGYNVKGQLGLGDSLSRGGQFGDLGDYAPALDLGTDLPIVKLTSGPETSCVLFEDSSTKKRSAKCWGSNDSGMLGLVYAIFPDRKLVWGDALDEVGVNLPFLPVPVDEELTDVALGRNNVCIVTNDDTVRCMHLGNSREYLRIDQEKPRRIDGLKIVQVARDSSIDCFLFDNKKMKCTGYGSMLGYGEEIQHINLDDLATAPFVATAGPVRKIATTPKMTCALLESGAIQCWGKNDQQQLAVGSTAAEVFKPSGAVDLGRNFGEVLDLSASSEGGMCALSKQGRVKCWGQVTAYGDGIARGAPETMGDNLPFMNFELPVKALGASCVILSNGGAKCWGSNSFGQLGVGDTIYRGIKPEDMGVNLPYMKLWD